MKKSKNAKSHLKKVSCLTSGESENIEKTENTGKSEDLKELHTTIWNTTKKTLLQFYQFYQFYQYSPRKGVEKTDEIDTMQKRIDRQIVLRTNALDAVSHIEYYVNYESG